MNWRGREDTMIGAEERLATSMDQMRREIFRLGRAQQALFAFVDSLAKILLTCVPEPGGEAMEAAVARARGRHARLLKSAGQAMVRRLALGDAGVGEPWRRMRRGSSGFDHGNRPRETNAQHGLRPTRSSCTMPAYQQASTAIGRPRLRPESHKTVQPAVCCPRYVREECTSGQWRAHGRYVARESATQDGDSKAVGFDGNGESIDIAERLESWQKASDERLWKVIVSPEFGDRADLKRLTRELLARMEGDLGTPLQWVAVAHYNTEHPHVHVALRGIDAEGHALRLSRDYIRQGIRYSAEDLCTRQLGYRTEFDAADGAASGGASSTATRPLTASSSAMQCGRRMRRRHSSQWCGTQIRTGAIPPPGSCSSTPRND